MLQERKKTLVLVLVLTYPFVLYGLIRAAPFITHNGLSYFIDNLERDLSIHPFRIFFVNQTPKIVLIGTIIYALIGAAIYDSLKNTRPGEEHGSARWATVREINKKYAAKEVVFPEAPKWMQDMILTNRARLGFDFYRHGKNGNTLIWGGPGTWKSRGYIIPNLMQMNCNYVVTDPKGELAKKMWGYAQENGISSHCFRRIQSREVGLLQSICVL